MNQVTLSIETKKLNIKETGSKDYKDGRGLLASFSTGWRECGPDVRMDASTLP